jgi:hypothetical protein
MDPEDRRRRGLAGATGGEGRYALLDLTTAVVTLL